MAMKVKYTVLDGEIISENRGGTISDYVPDSLGSTRFLLGVGQAITDSWNYYPYGEAVHVTGTNPTPMQFVGTAGYYTTSLMRAYVRARMLEKAKANWLTEDPIGFFSDDANLYRYVFNAPATVADPSGEDLTGCQINQGNKLCQGVNGAGWHMCTGSQWSACLAKCGGIDNVNYCCSNNTSVPDAGKSCICLIPPISKKPALPPKTNPPHPTPPKNNSPGFTPPSIGPRSPGNRPPPPAAKKSWFHWPSWPFHIPTLFPPGWEKRFGRP